jgi:hypothetical protein
VCKEVGGKILTVKSVEIINYDNFVGFEETLFILHESMLEPAESLESQLATTEAELARINAEIAKRDKPKMCRFTAVFELPHHCCVGNTEDGKGCEIPNRFCEEWRKAGITFDSTKGRAPNCPLEVVE